MRRAASLSEAMAANRSTDYYATLGVARNAKPDAIRKAYRHLARKYHPDVNPGDTVSETRFKEVQEAYGVLSDKRKREFYDQYGFYSEQAFAEGTGARSTGRRPSGFGFDGFDFTDFGRQAGAGPGAEFGSLFDTFFGGGQRPKRTTAEKHPGEDLEYTMEIDFRDAIEGTTARLNIARYSSCATCSGSGSARRASPQDCRECGGSGQLHKAAGNMRFSVPCATCRGEGKIPSLCSVCGGDGRVSSNVPIDVRIPPGTQENSRLRIPGKGNAGLRGGPPGDLYIVARVGAHPFFERKGYDIHIQVPVSPAEAILGAKIEVPTIDGTAFLRVPPATNSGKTFRVRERGVRNPRSGKRGDQFVRITIVVPEIPDETTKELMRQYAERNSENPRETILGQL